MADIEKASVYTRLFWAKASPYRQRGPERIHLLEHHLADVGACLERLLAQPAIRQRLARAGGHDDLDPATVARLSVLAAFHDIGKVNIGFQTQVWTDADIPVGERRPPQAGHTLDLTPVLNNGDRETADWFFDALGWWRDATESSESWDDKGGATVCALFIAALSHHGRPLQMEGGRSHNPAIWRPFGRLRPKDYVERLGSMARGWFPDAWSAGARPLPSAPPFQHMFLGLCNLADWIGSNTNWFPFQDEPRDGYIEEAREQARRAIDAIGLDLHEQRRLFAGTPEFPALFPHADGPPNAIQEATAAIAPEEQLVIIESETGSGKTEAALGRFARMYESALVDGLYFALPTRAAATQLHGRVTRFVERMFPSGSRPQTVLAVPGYLKAGGVTGTQLPHYEVEWDDNPDGDVRHQRWAAESAKRYLAAQIAVGTVDQAMLAALQVKNAHMRAACLARNLLVVDEVHASDPYMRRILKALLDAHLGAGGYALLMSATLGAAARSMWLAPGRLDPDDVPSLKDAIVTAYPAVSTMGFGPDVTTSAGENDRQKTINVAAEPLMDDFDAAAARALEAARAGAKVLVVRNTVGHAVETQRAMEEAFVGNDARLLFACGDIPTLHHGRFAAEDRRLLDREVERRLGKDASGGGLAVVGTQTLEQSLDIDADLLITDLCPADVLLQRIGRLHRHQRVDRPAGYAAPRCIVLTPEGEDLSPLLRRGPNRNGLGPHGGVYEDLRILEATRRLIVEHSQWDIPRMNRKLVERATHPEALEAIVAELGDDWRVHAHAVDGEEIAEGLTASQALIRRSKSFFTDNHDVLFASVEERVRTRLGDEGIDVELAPPPPSPFEPGRAIDRIAAPARWLRGVAVDGPAAPTLSDGGFTFTVGDRGFRYDKWGLRREGNR